MRTVSLHWRTGKVPSPVTQVFLREFVIVAKVQAKQLGLEQIN